MGAHRKNPPAGAAATIEKLAAQGHAKIGIAKKLGVSRQTFERWCEEDEALQEALEVGRETERWALHNLIVQAAVVNKGANANAMFLLKCRHGYREQDSPHTQVNVGSQVANVMVVYDHGTDAEWEAKAAAQQAALVLNASHKPVVKTLELEAAATASAAPAPSYAPVPPPSWDAPSWRGNA